MATGDIITVTLFCIIMAITLFITRDKKEKKGNVEVSK